MKMDDPLQFHTGVGGLLERFKKLDLSVTVDHSEEMTAD